MGNFTFNFWRYGKLKAVKSRWERVPYYMFADVKK